MLSYVAPITYTDIVFSSYKILKVFHPISHTSCSLYFIFPIFLNLHSLLLPNNYTSLLLLSFPPILLPFQSTETFIYSKNHRFIILNIGLQSHYITSPTKLIHKHLWLTMYNQHTIVPLFLFLLFSFTCSHFINKYIK